MIEKKRECLIKDSIFPRFNEKRFARPRRKAGEKPRLPAAVSHKGKSGKWSDLVLFDLKGSKLCILNGQIFKKAANLGPYLRHSEETLVLRQKRLNHE